MIGSSLVKDRRVTNPGNRPVGTRMIPNVLRTSQRRDHARTRWNNRKPGSGRFPGCGIIRIFGDEVHIAIRAPIVMHERVRGRREAIRLLEGRLQAEGKTIQ